MIHRQTTADAIVSPRGEPEGGGEMVRRLMSDPRPALVQL
jgi:hypothetical protein